MRYRLSFCENCPDRKSCPWWVVPESCSRYEEYAKWRKAQGEGETS